MSLYPLPSSVGTVRRIAGTNPAANNEVSVTVPVAANEVQSISGTPSATFGLTLDGATGPISLSTSATAQNIQDYLNAFSALSPDGVVCTGGPLPTAVTITYSGSRAQFRNWSSLSVAGGATGITISVTTEGTNDKSWYLISVSVALVQGATQTPQPVLVIDDGATTLFESFGSSAAQAVSTTCQYTWAPGLTLTGQVGATVNVHSNAPLSAGMVLPSGYRVRTNTIGLGANSDYGAPAIFVCELG